MELSYDFVVENDLQSDVADREFVGESAFDLRYSELRLFGHESFNFVDGVNDVRDIQEDALPPNHIANLELYLFGALKNLINFVSVLRLLSFQDLFNGAFLDCLLLIRLLFEEHLFLDPR